MTAQFAPTGRSASELADAVERAVRDGDLAPGQRLPAIREVAADLDVSPTTVAAAYRSLRERGLIDTHPRGSRVAHRPPVRLLAAPPLPDGVVDLSDGNPDPALLPPLADHLPRLLAGRPPVLYGEPADLDVLVELARGQLRADGVADGQLTVVGGALDGIERVLSTLLRRGDRVAVEDPTFDAVLDLLRAMHLQPVPAAVDDEGARPEGLADALRAGVRACILTPRAQNPTGAAITAGRAGELRDVLAPHPDVLVVEDDHAAGVAGTDHHPLFPDGREHWAVVRAAGKALSPDLRIAVVAGDATTISRVAGRRALGTGWVSTLLQRLLVAVWTDPATPGRLELAGRTYRARRETLIAALLRHGLDAHGRSGWNVWVPVDDETATVEHLRDAGWAVRAGHRFRISSPPAIRVTTARLEPEQADRLAADLAAGLDAARPTRTA